MNSMRAAVLWVYLLRGAALHDSPVDTLVAASRGTARVAEKVCFTRRGASSALCLPLLPAGNSNLCGGRTCYVMDRAVLSDAASVGAVGREGVVSHGIATPFPAEGMLGWESPHLPGARWLDMVQHGTLRFWVCIRGHAAGEIVEVKAARDECEEKRPVAGYPNKAACGCGLTSRPARPKRGADGGPAPTAPPPPWALRVAVSAAGGLATMSVVYDGIGVTQIFQDVEDAYAERPRRAHFDDVLAVAWTTLQLVLSAPSTAPLLTDSCL
jgi:hypothetical protein